MGYENLASVREPRALAVYERYRDQFPVTQHVVYLNHAAVTPLCKPAADAMKRHTDDACQYGSLHYSSWLDAYAGLRSAAARLIGAQPDEIALVKNTSEGIATVALGLRWRPGDRVIAFREEFPANYYPWKRLEQRGVKIRWLSIYDSLEQIAEALPGARLLSISYVNYLRRLSGRPGGDRCPLPATRLLLLCRRHSGPGRAADRRRSRPH